MPSVSEKQRKFMGVELARKRAGEKTKTGMSEKQLSEFAGSVKHHSPIEGPQPGTDDGSIYTRHAPVEYAADAFDSRPFDMHSVGRDWAPLRLDERIFHRDDDTQEQIDVENGILFYPGERESTQD